MAYGEAQALRDPELSIVLDERTLDPAMHYRLAAGDRPGRVASLKRRGYRLVSRKQDKVKLLHDAGDDRGDDHIWIGDMVLMCTPKDLYEQGRRAIEERNKQRFQAPESKFQERIAAESRRLGQPIKVIGPDKEDES